VPASITPPETARPILVRVRRIATPEPDAAARASSAGRLVTAAPRWYGTLQRGADIVVSSLALLALLPLFGIIALAIKLSSPGPVFYQQVRVGLNRRDGERRKPRPDPGPGDRRGADRRSADGHGRPFRIYKFRTMVPNAEEYGPQWSKKGDQRIFPVGRFLRLTRLDETPQFLNVVKGDMSLIGPRPERPYFVEQFAETIPNYRERLRVRPGITGRAQVKLDYDASIDDVKKKLEQDLQYIRRRSLVHDLEIVFRTIWVVLTGKGAA